MQPKTVFASSLLVATFFLQQIPSHAQETPAQTANSQTDSNKPAQAPPDMSHMQHGMSHGGFMQGGMHHAVAKGVKIEQTIDGHTIIVRVGPMTLPAHTSHMKMPQPPDLVWQIPIDGWLLGYTPKLVDSNGKVVPGTVLHHVAFWNEERPDFLCLNKEEHIFGAGSEMTNWSAIPGYGYRVKMGDKIRVETMMHNPTDISYDKVYLEIAIPYQDAGKNSGASEAALKNFYPAWMDVKSCGNSSYNLAPGKSEMRGIVTVRYDGVLLGVGGHMHDFARQIVLEDVTRKETVATLDAQVDAKGHLEGMPVKLFLQDGGYKFAAGDQLRISATYDNTTGEMLRDGAMGIVVGYFVPADDAPVVALRGVKGNPMKHEMPGMSHDQ
jgi:hypothetical protein